MSVTNDVTAWHVGYDRDIYCFGYLDSGTVIHNG